jgi:hypothetical protein
MIKIRMGSNGRTIRRTDGTTTIHLNVTELLPPHQSESDPGGMAATCRKIPTTDRITPLDSRPRTPDVMEKYRPCVIATAGCGGMSGVSNELSGSLEF